MGLFSTSQKNEKRVAARAIMNDRDEDELIEIAIVGDLGENEADITEKLLGVPLGGSCILYFDSPGGSPYSGMALTNLILLRGIHATGVVTGECSSAALWPFAACARRLVTNFTVLLFHTMKWQSDEHVGLAEAAEWARHFASLEGDMDKYLAQLLGTTNEKIAAWMQAGKYVSGPEFADAGFGELIPVERLPFLNAAAARQRKPRKRRKARRG